jgi:hypothetical protein
LENRNDELPALPQGKNPPIKAQGDDRKTNSGYALRQAVWERKMQRPILPLVNHRESEFIHHGNVNRFPSLSRAGR